MSAEDLDLTDFVWERLGEQYDAQPKQSLWRATLFALRHGITANTPRLQRRYAAKFPDHPDYREEWRP